MGLMGTGMIMGMVNPGMGGMGTITNNGMGMMGNGLGMSTNMGMGSTNMGMGGGMGGSMGPGMGLGMGNGMGMMNNGIGTGMGVMNNMNNINMMGNGMGMMGNSMGMGNSNPMMLNNTQLSQNNMMGNMGNPNNLTRQLGTGLNQSLQQNQSLGFTSGNALNQPMINNTLNNNIPQSQKQQINPNVKVA
jgi:hypothetical protein